MKVFKIILIFLMTAPTAASAQIVDDLAAHIEKFRSGDKYYFSAHVLLASVETVAATKLILLSKNLVPSVQEVREIERQLVADRTLANQLMEKIVVNRQKYGTELPPQFRAEEIGDTVDLEQTKSADLPVKKRAADYQRSVRLRDNTSLESEHRRILQRIEDNDRRLLEMQQRLSRKALRMGGRIFFIAGAAILVADVGRKVYCILMGDQDVDLFPVLGVAAKDTADAVGYLVNLSTTYASPAPTPHSFPTPKPVEN